MRSRAQRYCSSSDDLNDELSFIEKTMASNAHDRKRVHGQLFHPKLGPSLPKDTSQPMIVLRYAPPLFSPLRGYLSRQGFKVVYKTARSLRSELFYYKAKPSSPATGCIYALFCNGSRDLSEQCGRVYVGQTGRTIVTRAKEDAKAMERSEVEKSAVNAHCVDRGFRGCRKLYAYIR